MDVPSIKNLKITLQLLEQLKFPQEKIILILNRSDTKVGITAEEIKKTINKNIDVAIPSNRIVPLSVNKGIPVVIENPRSPVARSIHKISILLILQSICQIACQFAQTVDQSSQTVCQSAQTVYQSA